MIRCIGMRLLQWPDNNISQNNEYIRSQWLRSLGPWGLIAWTPGAWVRILLEAWMCVFVYSSSSSFRQPVIDAKY
jgi:hypothetical protein